MESNFTLRELQNYIKEKDFHPERKHDYFLKLFEEVGELSEVIRKENRLEENKTIKGTIEEELYDVFYYVICLANAYDIDLEKSFRLKEAINREKYR